jgi:hypothetical protein
MLAVALLPLVANTMECAMPQWAVNSSCTSLPFDTTIATHSSAPFATVTAFSIQVAATASPYFTITLNPTATCSGPSALMGPDGLEIDYPLDVGQPLDLNLWKVNQTFTNAYNNANSWSKIAANWTFWIETHPLSCSFDIKVESRPQPKLLLPGTAAAVSINHHEWTLFEWASMLSQPFELTVETQQSSCQGMYCS